MTEMSNDDLRNEAGKALEPLWWIRQYLDDDSEQAKAFDEVRAFSQGLDETPAGGSAPADPECGASVRRPGPPAGPPTRGGEA